MCVSDYTETSLHINLKLKVKNGNIFFKTFSSKDFRLILTFGLKTSLAVQLQVKCTLSL